MCPSEAQPVYWSPHLDDAVLSCGGLICRQVRDQLQPWVVSVFAGHPDARALSPFAARQHKKWGGPQDPVSFRKAEDAAAMDHLGIDYQHWNYLDCIYRRHPETGRFLYASERALFGAVDPAEKALVSRLAQDFAAHFRRERIVLYTPLAVGQHVDHQIVLQAALELRKSGFQVRFFEDYPYAGDPKKLTRALQAWGCSPLPVVQVLTEWDMATKVAAIALYGSQLPVLFGNEAAMAKQVRAYALAVGGGQELAERYWQEGQFGDRDL